MTLALSLCWLGMGLWVFADAGRARRVWPLRVGQRRARLLRCLAAALLLAAAVPLVRLEGGALGSVALLLCWMVVLSVAVLVFPLRPRLYAASVALAGLVALAGAVCH